MDAAGKAREAMAFCKIEKAREKVFSWLGRTADNDGESGLERFGM
jgi:hypothetical protein